MTPLDRPRWTAAAARADVASGGARCPCCGSPAIEADGVESGDHGFGQVVRCAACSGSWRELYTLTGIEPRDDPGRAPASPTSS